MGTGSALTSVSAVSADGGRGGSQRSKNLSARLPDVRRHAARILVPLAGVVGLALLAIGIVYLTVACEDLPGILGPTPGDTSPRIVLGVVAVVLGVAALLVVFLVARRGPPTTPLQS